MCGNTVKKNMITSEIKIQTEKSKKFSPGYFGITTGKNFWFSKINLIGVGARECKHIPKHNRDNKFYIKK